MASACCLNQTTPGSRGVRSFRSRITSAHASSSCKETLTTTTRICCASRCERLGSLANRSSSTSHASASWMWQRWGPCFGRGMPLFVSQGRSHSTLNVCWRSPGPRASFVCFPAWPTRWSSRGSSACTPLIEATPTTDVRPSLARAHCSVHRWRRARRHSRRARLCARRCAGGQGRRCPWRGTPLGGHLASDAVAGNDPVQETLATSAPAAAAPVARYRWHRRGGLPSVGRGSGWSTRSRPQLPMFISGCCHSPSRWTNAGSSSPLIGDSAHPLLIDRRSACRSSR